MPLNKQKGNMYPWITHTWNPIRGKCPHSCSYCYMKRIPNVGELRFVEKEMSTNLGKDNTIFIGSSCDMWAFIVQDEWIGQVLNHCLKYPKNTYVFQTKNPLRFYTYNNQLTDIKPFLATTIETNRYWLNKGFSESPSQKERATYLGKLFAYKKFVSIEPIMDFDQTDFFSLIYSIKPKFVSIGADSGYNNLLEPSAWKIKRLIKELEKFTEVKIKDNLGRLLK